MGGLLQEETMKRLTYLSSLCLALWLPPQGWAEDAKLGLFTHQTDIGEVQHKGTVEIDTNNNSYTVSGGSEDMWFDKDAKPDFQIMVYPGPLGIPDTIPADAPPAFLLVANDDRGASRVISKLFQGYREAKRPVEAHIFMKGGHAFNMGNRSKLKALSKWPERLSDWLSDNDYLKPLN
jgi:acetyl esterase/lipase